MAVILSWPQCVNPYVVNFFDEYKTCIHIDGLYTIVNGVMIFSGAKSILVGIPLTNALGENRQFFLQIMFTSCHLNSAIVQYLLSKFAHMYLFGINYQWLWRNCCKSNFGDIDAINLDNACCGPNGTSAWPRSLHEPSIHRGQSSVRWWSPAVRASPIGSNQVWRLCDVDTLARILW